mgnify:FL=1
MICCVRDKRRFSGSEYLHHPGVTLLEVDFLNASIPSMQINDIDAAYYLIHSMSTSKSDFEALEKTAVDNFIRLVKNCGIKQVIYLGGLTNNQKLSKHLSSRKNVEELLVASGMNVTVLRAGIIVGSGSASFEIIRDLVEKLPIMITPKWLNTLHQPVAVRNVLECLIGVLGNEQTYSQSFDIGSPDVLSYRQMLLTFAQVRGLKRVIWTVPVMTPRLSSYWLYFVTSTSYNLAVSLVDSMKTEVVASETRLLQMLNIRPIPYKEALELAFRKIETHDVISSWKDSLVSGRYDASLFSRMDVPKEGCFIDRREFLISGEVEHVLSNIWSIGGETGWYYADWLWHIRGFLDKLFGGVGLRRGRTNPTNISVGDTLDFWRVLDADRQSRRLLLFAEMKLPGEAWLEFLITEKKDQTVLIQTATFRPRGLSGRLYWYSVVPFHHLIFGGMGLRIISKRNPS